MKYQVARNANLSAFIKEVEGMLKKGYEPLGGVAVDSDECYCQALIKRRPGTDTQGAG